jgi:phenylalanyl-tRNA synthetase beta chain
MQFPESWLREFCNPPLSTAQLADTLTMAGLEVEDTRPVAPAFSHVVVGEVLAVHPHPDADRLKVCQVQVGIDNNLTIVCGAPNVRVGIKVPCALVGAQLPGADGQTLHIKLGKLRGIESAGMLCSASELGLTSSTAGLMVLPDDAPTGNSIRDYLQLDDTLFTLKLTPNLAHALSVYGIARELSALTGSPLRTLTPLELPIPFGQSGTKQHLASPQVTITAPDLCGRFVGRVISHTNPQATTPQWMADRLERCGQRSISPLVDISNYVMFERGQPSHIFDLDKIQGPLSVRWARAAESLELLSGETKTLDTNTGVVADGQGPIALAGIMGGLASSVTATTEHIYLETAFWRPESIAGRARRYQCNTDASHRFERGVDYAQTASTNARITQLILEICGGQAGPADDHITELPSPQPIVLRSARFHKIIGMPLAPQQGRAVLERLGLQPTENTTQGTLTVTPPSWRFDLHIEEDLIEEIIRVIGFEQLPDTPPRAPITPRVLPESRRSLHQLRRQTAALDYQETINFSFVQERWERELAGNTDPIRLLNPISAPLSVMRSQLWGGLIDILRFNLARKATRVRIFEVGRVFQRDLTAVASDQQVAGVQQPMHLGGLAYGPAQPLHWQTKDRTVDFFDVKGDIEILLSPQRAVFAPTAHPALHPGRAAQIEINGQVVGHLGELHPRWRQAYELLQAPVLFEINALALTHKTASQYVPVQRQQSVWRDIAVLVGPKVAHDALVQTAMQAEPLLVRSVNLFDIYQPQAPAQGTDPHERSVALRIELLDDSQPLTDERIEAVKLNIISALNRGLQARLRV